MFKLRCCVLNFVLVEGRTRMISSLKMVSEKTGVYFTVGIKNLTVSVL